MRTEAPVAIQLTLWLLVLANVWFGLDPSLPLTLSTLEAKTLLGVGQ